VESAYEYYKIYITLYFIQLVYEKILENLDEGDTDFKKERINKEKSMIQNKISRIEPMKVLLKTIWINHIRLSEKVDLIADNLKYLL